jgi:hypothetical protein
MAQMAKKWNPHANTTAVLTKNDRKENYYLFNNCSE